MPARRRGPEGGGKRGRGGAAARGVTLKPAATAGGRLGSGARADSAGDRAVAGGSPGEAAAALARLLAQAAEQRAAIGAGPVDAGGHGDGSATTAAADGARRDEALRLIAALSADPAAVDGFFPLLGAELKARGLRLAPEDVRPTPEAAPLVAALAAALDGQSADGEVDFEQAARLLDDALRDLLGASPRDLRRQALDARMRERAAERVAASMRQHGLVPLEDAAAAGGDPFWDLVDVARRDPAAFRQALHTMPEQALTDFYWAHVAAASELQRAWRRGAAEPPDAADGRNEAATRARVAAWVAAGYEAHAQAVAHPAGAANRDDEPSRDLGTEAAQAFRIRFGREVG